ncbi:hypothetical protein T10_6340 [Trichinella papuae]|uniref:Uncharacterized protein n=1 Tax=Trichinella papuae TaxID=268474 RepID=A0A0V1MU11_9BILA|nr:hypothetical protein T10_6340 [Trichinella papuae]KRZ74943.1 hypothetical protein T10_6340 [Trichinella papuae]
MIKLLNMFNGLLVLRKLLLCMAQSYGNQTCSTLYIFSTQLANRAAQAVNNQKFSSIIEFHQNQEETRRILSANIPFSCNVKTSTSLGKRSALKLNAEGNQESGNVKTGNSPQESTSSVDGGDLATPLSNEGQSKSEISVKGNAQIENVPSPHCNLLATVAPLVKKDLDITANVLQDASAIFPPTPGKGSGVLKVVDANSMSMPDLTSKLCDTPLEKMAKLTEEALPSEPPMKHSKLGSPRDRSKFTDEQLTPAQRQHRQEALQRIEDLKNFFGMSSQQQQQTIMAMNAAGQGPLPPGLLPSFPVNDGKLAVDNATGVTAPGIPQNMPAVRNDQIQVDAQLQWQQLVAEHEAKKQMQQGISTTSTICRNATPPTVAAPGTRMMVQGKPAMMVPPVAPPRNSQRTPTPRLQHPPRHNSQSAAQENFSECSSVANFQVPSGQGQPYPQGYDVNMQTMPPFSPVQGKGMGPRFVGGNGFCGDAGAMMVVGNRMQAPNVRPFQGGPNVLPPEMCDPSVYGMMPPPLPDESYCDGMYVRNNFVQCPPQQPVGGNFEMNAYRQPVGGNKMPNVNPMLHPPPMDVINGGGPRPTYVASGFDFEMQSASANQCQPSSIPMVNNTFVNATMSIQQVNIQNVSPYSPGIISIQGRPVQPNNSFSSGPRYFHQQQRPGPAQSPYGKPAVRPAGMMSVQSGCFPVEPNTASFFSDFAEPLTNLDSKVPSQKLQYFPDPIQQQQQQPTPPPPPPPPSQPHNYPSVPLVDSSAMQYSMNSNQQQPSYVCQPGNVIATGYHPQGYSATTQQTSQPAVGPQSINMNSTTRMMHPAGPRMMSSQFVPSPGSAASGMRENAYQIQFQNFQQQLYATSVRRPESNSA